MHASQYWASCQVLQFHVFQWPIENKGNEKISKKLKEHELKERLRINALDEKIWR